MSIARDPGVRTFTASVLDENYAMLRVFADAGLHARRELADGVTELAFDLPGDVADPGWGPYLDAVAARVGHADAASLRHVFAAESVAVVGASRRPELDLNPVIARPDGAHVVDARVRLLPAQPVDPYLRRLR